MSRGQACGCVQANSYIRCHKDPARGSVGYARAQARSCWCRCRPHAAPCPWAPHRYPDPFAMHSTSRVVDAVPSSGLSTPVLVLMAVACGLCAGGNYFNQPLLHSIALTLQISDSAAALTVTLAQVAYAAGLLFLVPLGDKLERRRLAVGLI